MNGKDRDRYHHGDLRNALLIAAGAMLEEEGLDALSLRAVAARAGVSHAAPAHHFATLKDLLTALATLAFDKFARTLGEARGSAGPSARSQLAAAGDGYIRFARENAQAFRLMFSPSRLDWTSPALVAAGEAAYGQLAAICAPVAAARGETSPEAVRALELLVWTSVHGYAHLLLSGQLVGMGGPSGSLPPRPDLETLLLGPAIRAPARDR